MKNEGFTPPKYGLAITPKNEGWFPWLKAGTLLRCWMSLKTVETEGKSQKEFNPKLILVHL